MHGIFRAIAALLIATGIPACQSAASQVPSMSGQGPVQTPGPQWARLEAGEPLYGAPFDASYGPLTGVAYREGFVLVGTTEDAEGRIRGGIWSSPDGDEWVRIGTEDEQLDDTYLSIVGTDGRRLIALGSHAPWPNEGRPGPNVAWLSDDGVTWARHDLEQTDLGRVDVDGIVGSASGFLAWGEQQDRHTLLLRSSDGLDWQAVDYPDSADANIRSVAAYGAGFIAVGGGFNEDVLIGEPSEPARAWWSPDGRDWVAADVPGGFELSGVYPAAAVVFAVGDHECSRCVGPSLTWGSPDGRTWHSLGEERQIYPMFASNGGQIAAFESQDDRSVSLSSDGLNWAKLARVPAAHHDAGMIVGSTGVLVLMAMTPIGADGMEDIHPGVLFLKGS
jgi:hypothetical protein